MKIARNVCYGILRVLDGIDELGNYLARTFGDLKYDRQNAFDDKDPGVREGIHNLLNKLDK